MFGRAAEAQHGLNQSTDFPWRKPFEPVLDLPCVLVFLAGNAGSRPWFSLSAFLVCNGFIQHSESLVSIASLSRANIAFRICSVRLVLSSSFTSDASFA